jgi:hypothetical protein
VDLSDSLKARQRDRLAAYASKVQWVSALPDRIRGVVVGTEVLDAMPVKLLHFDGQAWQERGVVFTPKGFAWEDRPTNRRPPYDASHWVAGTVTEVHPQAKAWVRTVAAALEAGALSEWRATLIVRESACLDVDDRRALDAELCADAARLAGLGDRRVTAEARAIAYRLDPHAVVAGRQGPGGGQQGLGACRVPHGLDALRQS